MLLSFGICYFCGLPIKKGWGAQSRHYNAAHPGAEMDIFPHYAARRPLTVAYTATSWRKLLKKPVISAISKRL